MFYYKLVYDNDGEYQSMVTSGLSNTTYPLNKWAQAPKWLRELNFGLTCFGNLRDVINYMSSNGRHPIIQQRDYEQPGAHKVFLCEVKGKLKRHHLCRLYELGKGRAQHTSTNHDWPEGTLFYEKIKITELVPYDELIELYEEMYG